MFNLAAFPSLYKEGSKEFSDLLLFLGQFGISLAL